MAYVTSSGIKIYYEVEGNNKPPLLMIHGNGNCVSDWHDLGYVDLLKNDFNLILLDCRGYGKSDKPHDPAMYTPETITQDCIAVLDAIGIDKAHVYGGSRGANMVLLLAKFFPERCLSYSINDAEVYENTAHQGLLELLVANKEKGMVAVVEDIESWLDDQFPDAIRANYIANDIDAMIAASQMAYPDLSVALNGNKASCCLMVSNSEPWVYQMPKFYQEHPDFEYHKFDDKSHAELYWDAKTVAPILIDFLKK